MALVFVVFTALSVIVSMNRSVPAVVLSTVTSARGRSKSTRRKRQRAKWFNYYLKKRRFRKCNGAKKANLLQFNNSRGTSITEQIMSNWYWDNYNKSLEWQDRHQLAHWKATALALLEENRYLLEIIKNVQPGMVPEASVTQANLHNVSNTNKSGHKINPSKNVQNLGTFMYNCNSASEEGDEESAGYEEDVKDEDDGNDDSDFEIEMSEEMMQFFEQSHKHKMELKKLREKELQEKTEKEIEEIKIRKTKRSSEMIFLYGEGASMITGMETAVQLGFNKYCDSKSPKFWPNIPFRL